MRSYFVANLRNWEHCLETLRRATVPFCNFECEGVNGIIIDESFIAAALQTLNMHITEERTTCYDGIYYLVLGPEYSAPVQQEPRQAVPPRIPSVELKVLCEEWGSNLQSRGEYVQLLEAVLLPVVLKTIILYGSNDGEKRAPIENGNFRVLMWYGINSERGSGISPERVWNLNFPARGSWFAPSEGDGTVIRTPENEAVIAEIVGNNLYILAPVAYHSIQYGPQIFRRILEEVAAELSLSPEQKIERDRQRAEAEKVRIAAENAETRIKYIELCKQRLQQVLDDARMRVAKSEQALEEVQTSIVTTHRELVGSKCKLDQLRKRKEEEDKRFAAEFEKICALEQVEEVAMRDGKNLQIMTSLLTCQDPNTGKTHELGKFRIMIPVNGGNLRWFNLTRQVDGLEPKMHSPVVDANGCTILINAIQAFPELIANYEIATVVQLALQVPGAIDPSEEHAKHLNKWPEATAAA